MKLKGSIYSGVLIGIAGWINLAVGGGIPGALLFTLGLILVCFQDLDLYTGKCGSVPFDFLSYKMSLGYLGKVLLGNIIGTGIIALLTRNIDVVNCAADVIVFNRASTGWWNALVKGIGCGFMMEMAVWCYREKKTVLPMFLCVPGFILSGMHHCIADSYYILCSSVVKIDFAGLIPTYLLAIVGNFIGCNLRRILS